MLWIWGLQIPWFDRSNLFFTTDFKSVWTPNGGVERLVGGFQIRRDGKGRSSLGDVSCQNQYALKGQKLLAQGIALGRYVCKPVAL